MTVREPPARDEAWAGPRRHTRRARGDAKAPIGCILPGVHASGGVQAAAVVVRVLEHRPLVCRVALVKRRLPERHLPSGKLLEVVRTTGDSIRKVEGCAPRLRCARRLSTRLKTGSALLNGVAAVDNIVRSELRRLRRVDAVVALRRHSAVVAVACRCRLGRDRDHALRGKAVHRRWDIPCPWTLEHLTNPVLDRGQRGQVIVVD